MNGHEISCARTTGFWSARRDHAHFGYGCDLGLTHHARVHGAGCHGESSNSNYGGSYRDRNRDRDRNRQEFLDFDPDSDFDFDGTEVLIIRIATVSLPRMATAFKTC